MKAPFLALLLSLVLWGCNSPAPKQNEASKPPAETPAPAETLTFTSQKIEKSFGTCKAEDSDCFKVKVAFPVASGTNAAAFNAVVDTLVAHQFQVGDGAKPKTLDEGIQQYGQEFLMFVRENPDAVNSWEKELKAEVVFQDEHWVTMRVTSYSFEGGAHPNSYLQYVNFSPDGKVINMASRIQDKNKLLTLAETAFRKVREFPDKGSLNDQGMQFENDQFVLPLEMGLTKDGLVLYYNPYEVGPYAAGATEVVLPAANLKGIVNL